MNELPSYVNCRNKEIEHCDFYLHQLCPKTCAYALDIKPQGIGSIQDKGLLKRIRETNE